MGSFATNKSEALANDIITDFIDFELGAHGHSKAKINQG